MHPNSLRLMAALMAAVLGLSAAAALQPRLAGGRAALGLAPPAAEQEAPPLVTFMTVTLGGFRGLLADVLWLRATRLQDEGRYVELVQLAGWISSLEPRSTRTWSFHAWNMAYNVAGMMADPAERWRWIRNGMRLLWADALRYNPSDARLHAELGWMYQHKLGTAMDPAAASYRRTLAAAVAAVLPEGRLTPGAAANPDVAATLLREFGLRVASMQTLESHYGALDWRLPETHTVYWGRRGLEASGDHGNLFCTRLVLQGLMALVAGGRAVGDPATGTFHGELDPERLDAVLQAYDGLVVPARWPRGPAVFADFLREAAPRLEAAGHPERAARARARLAALPRPE